MHTLDASSIIHAWENYPIQKFPNLWNWVAEQCEGGDLCIPAPALQETLKIAPDCGNWLKKSRIRILPLTNEVIQEAARVKNLLGISNDEYAQNGVGENDLFIIASTMLNDGELVSNEARQNILPKVKAKYKIPAVCALPAVDVPCVSFVEYLNQFEAVFG